MKDNIYALAVSDTHGNTTSLKQITEKYRSFNYLFHLGDNAADAIWLADRMPNTKVVYVRGNCDFNDNASDFETVILKGNKIILTHGHKLKVKYGYDRALYYALENEAQALLFGHTHIPYANYEDGVWLINPGSAGELTGGELTVCVMLICKNGIIPKIVSVKDDNPLKAKY